MLLPEGQEVLLNKTNIGKDIDTFIIYNYWIFCGKIRWDILVFAPN